jgi:hypothetical protein
MDAKTFEEKTKEFSSHISSTLNDTLSGPVAKVHSDVTGPQASIIRTTKKLISDNCPGKQFGVLASDFSCCASSSGRYFAVEESHIRIKIGYGEKTRPVIRIDFNRDDNSYISCMLMWWAQTVSSTISLPELERIGRVIDNTYRRQQTSCISQWAVNDSALQLKMSLSFSSGSAAFLTQTMLSKSSKNHETNG